MTFDTIADFASRTGDSLKSIAKIALQTRRPTLKPVDNADSIIVMGNGPSLADTIARHSDLLTKHPTLAVNFAANAPEFFTLKPRFYVLADPHFFMSTGNDNVTRLHDNLSAVDWPMTLFVPAQYAAKAPGAGNRNIDLRTYNAVGVEGYRWLENAAFKAMRGMPRPRNVLIPSIMIALALGFKNVYIVGADHSWTRTLSVNENNEVVSIQPHFYKDNASELARTKAVSMGLTLHGILQSMVVAFRSYHTIERYARHIGTNVYNSTPDSFIDAFRRRPLEMIDR